jgi:hypothetical protein
MTRYFPNPFEKDDVGRKINQLESDLQSRGVDVPPAQSRGFWDRTFDTLSVGLYPTMGALKSLIDNDPKTTYFGAIRDGLRAANPFGKGYEKGEVFFSDVLDTVGWKKTPNPQGKIYNPLSWKPNNIAHGLVGLAGDIFLDPTTYLTLGTGAVARGVGAGVKGGARALGRETAEKGLAKLSSGGAREILERFGLDASDDMAKALTNKVKRDTKYFPSQGRGLSWGIGDARITFMSDDAIRNSKLAQTVSPYVNSALDALGSSKTGQKISKVFKSSTARESLKMARENPEGYAERVAKLMKDNERFRTFEELQNLTKQTNQELFKGLDVKTNRLMSDIMENPDFFKIAERQVGTTKTLERSKEAQQLFDDLTKAQQDIGNLIKSYEDLRVYNKDIDNLQQIQNKLKELTDIDVVNFESYMYKANIYDDLSKFTNEYRELLNSVRDMEVPDIIKVLKDRGYDDFVQQSGTKIPTEEMAYMIRRMHDNIQSKMSPLARRYYTGEEMMYFPDKFSAGKPMTDKNIKPFTDVEVRTFEAIRKFARNKYSMKTPPNVIRQLIETNVKNAQLDVARYYEYLDSVKPKTGTTTQVNLNPKPNIQNVNVENDVWKKRNLDAKTDTLKGISLNDVTIPEKSRFGMIEEIASYRARNSEVVLSNKAKGVAGNSYIMSRNQEEFRLNKLDDVQLRKVYESMYKEKMITNTYSADDVAMSRAGKIQGQDVDRASEFVDSGTSKGMADKIQSDKLKVEQQQYPNQLSAMEKRAYTQSDLDNKPKFSKFYTNLYEYKQQLTQQGKNEQAVKDLLKNRLRSNAEYIKKNSDSTLDVDKFVKDNYDRFLNYEKHYYTKTFYNDVDEVMSKLFDDVNTMVDKDKPIFTGKETGIDVGRAKYFGKGNKSAKIPTEVSDKYEMIEDEIKRLEATNPMHPSIEIYKNTLDTLKPLKIDELRKVAEQSKWNNLNNFGDEKIQVSKYNYNGNQIYEKTGSKQPVKADHVIRSLKLISKFDPVFGKKLGNFQKQLTTWLTDIHTWTEGFSTKNNIFITRNIDAPINEIGKRVAERIIPHEVAHEFARVMYNLIHKKPLSKEIMKLPLEQKKLKIAELKKLKRFDEIHEPSFWGKIIGKEGTILQGAGRITSKIEQEDFAESLAWMIRDPKTLMQEKPIRYKALSEKLNQFIVPDPKTPIDKNIASRYFEMPRTSDETLQAVLSAKQRNRENIVNTINTAKIPENEAIKQLEDLNKTLGSDEELRAIFQSKYPNLAYAVEVEKPIYDKVIELSSKDIARVYGNEVASVLEKVKNDFYRMGIKEGIPNIDETILSYVPHMITKKLTDGIKTNISKDVNNKGMFKNVHKDKRIWVNESTGKDLKIIEVNEIVERNGGGANYFETQLNRIHLNRALRHNQYIFDTKFFKDTAETFGTPITDIKSIPTDKKLYASSQDVIRALQTIDSKDIEATVKTLNLPEELTKSVGVGKDINMFDYKPVVEIPADTFVKLKNIDNGFNTYVLPDLIVADLNSYGKMMLNEQSSVILNIYDKFLQNWKTQATAINPGFHIRNATSNIFQNYLNVGAEAINPKNQYYAAKLLGNDVEYLKNTFIDVKGKGKISLYDIQQKAIQTGALDLRGRFASETSNIVDNTNPTGTVTQNVANTNKGFNINKLNPLSQIFDVTDPVTNKFNKNRILETLTQKPQDFVTNNNQFVLYQLGRNAGSTVESHAKALNFLANVKNGADFLEAADNTKKFLFDYSDLSDIEQKVFKRVVPFYTWMRKNIPLQLEMLFDKPFIYKGYGIAKENIERASGNQRLDDTEKNEFAQNWIQLPFTSKGKSGKPEPMFFNPSLPLADLERADVTSLPKTLFSSFTPFAKVPIELLANKNVYFNSPISRGVGDMREAPSYLPVDKVDAKTRYVLQNIPMLENINKLTNTSSGAEEQGLSALKILGGANLYSFDVDKYKKWSLRDRLKQLRSLANNNE